MPSTIWYYVRFRSLFVLMTCNLSQAARLITWSCRRYAPTAPSHGKRIRNDPGCTSISASCQTTTRSTSQLRERSWAWRLLVSLFRVAFRVIAIHSFYHKRKIAHRRDMLRSKAWPFDRRTWSSINFDKLNKLNINHCKPHSNLCSDSTPNVTWLPAL